MFIYGMVAVLCAFVSEWYFKKDIKLIFRNWTVYVLAIVFACLFIIFSKTLSSEIAIIKAITITTGLYVASVNDIKSREIPNTVVLLFLVLGLILVIPAFNLFVYLDALGGALIAGGLLYAASFFSKGDVGMGDVKLFSVVGIYLGFFATLNAMLLAMLLGAIYGIVLMIIRKQGIKTSIPFAPFISLASVITIITM